MLLLLNGMPTAAIPTSCYSFGVTTVCKQRDAQPLLCVRVLHPSGVMNFLRYD